MKTLLMLLLVVSSLAIAAPPVPLADCGAGTTVVGSREAGKITLGDVLPGTSPWLHSCTLTFSWPKEPSCVALLERETLPDLDGGGPPAPGPYGTITTKTTLHINDWSGNVTAMREGFVIAYLCVGR